MPHTPTLGEKHTHMKEIEIIIYYTVQPSNKGHVRTSLYREVSFIRRLKCTGITGIGTSRFVLYREVFFIRSVLYRRFSYYCVYNSAVQQMVVLGIGL